jgi:hypothetical protein
MMRFSQVLRRPKNGGKSVLPLMQKTDAFGAPVSGRLSKLWIPSRKVRLPPEPDVNGAIGCA